MDVTGSRAIRTCQTSGRCAIRNFHKYTIVSPLLSGTWSPHGHDNNNVGATYCKQGKHSEALEVMKKALAVYDRALGTCGADYESSACVHSLTVGIKRLSDCLQSDRQ